MKVIIGVIVLVFILIGTAVGIFAYSATLYSDIQESIDIIENAVQNDNWELAERETANLQKLWDRGDLIWSAVMDHSQVDRVDESITQVVALVNLQIKDDLLLEISMARRLVNRLKENETPHFRSIF